MHVDKVDGAPGAVSDKLLEVLSTKGSTVSTHTVGDSWCPEQSLSGKRLHVLLVCCNRAVKSHTARARASSAEVRLVERE